MLPAFKLGADLVIAVDITADLENARDYTPRGGHHGPGQLDQGRGAGRARPAAWPTWSSSPRCKQVHWADFGDYDRCIAAGDEAATRGRCPGSAGLLRRERWLCPCCGRGGGRRLADLRLRRPTRRCAWSESRGRTRRTEATKPMAPEHVHLIGIGGTGMTALAGLLHSSGCRVTGSDGAALSADLDHPRRRWASRSARASTPAQPRARRPTSSSWATRSAGATPRSRRLLDRRPAPTRRCRA